MAVLRCIDAFAYTDRRTGRDTVVTAGALFKDTDPRVQGREHLFEVVDQEIEKVKVDPVPVEQATAAPGERRRVGRPRKDA